MKMYQAVSKMWKVSGVDFMFGIPAWRAGDREEFWGALAAALSSDDGMPKLIEARIDPSSCPRQFDVVREP